MLHLAADLETGHRIEGVSVNLRLAFRQSPCVIKYLETFQYNLLRAYSPFLCPLIGISVITPNFFYIHRHDTVSILDQQCRSGYHIFVLFIFIF